MVINEQDLVDELAIEFLSKELKISTKRCAAIINMDFTHVREAKFNASLAISFLLKKGYLQPG